MTGKGALEINWLDELAQTSYNLVNADKQMIIRGFFPVLHEIKAAYSILYSISGMLLTPNLSPITHVKNHCLESAHKLTLAFVEDVHIDVMLFIVSSTFPKSACLQKVCRRLSISIDPLKQSRQHRFCDRP